MQLSGISTREVNESLEELHRLAESAGAQILLSFQQKKYRPDAASYIGSGKAGEIKAVADELESDLVIFDEDLSPAQQRNLEKLLERRVIDRTELILDIFARRAQTKEGKLQVELAQLHYRLPRLAGKGIMMSRLGGGIGTRGPGETRLEVDRRRIRDRIRYLEKAIDTIKSQRSQQRSRRKESQIPIVALVGYTNAGKSTLLNHLCGAEVFVQDQLFATLDPTTRKLKLPDGSEMVLTDTVGLIRKLPHQLVAAFRATLEEIRQADLLLHVVDGAHPANEEHIRAVLQVLEELEIKDKPMITVFNKSDLIQDQQEHIERLVNSYSPSVLISAAKGTGFTELLGLLATHFYQDKIHLKLLIPHDQQDIMAFLHEQTIILKKEFIPEGIRVDTMVLQNHLRKLNPFKVS